MSNFTFNDTPEPDFADEGAGVDYDGEAKAEIRWENNQNEYVLVWFQDKFFKHHGYSMSGPLRDHVLDNLDHIDTVYIHAKNEGKIHEIPVSALERGKRLGPDHEDAQGDVEQYVVHEDEIVNTWST